MEFPLRCACGKRVVATDGMAGTQIPCVCGRHVRVPSLGEMRRQSPGYVAEEAAESAAGPAEPLRPAPAVVVYGLAVAWVCLAGQPLVLLSFLHVGPVAGAGALLLVVGQVWLFTQIFVGNPFAALMVLLVPIVGPLLALQFIID